LLNNVGKLVHLTEIVDDDAAVLNYLRMEKWVADGIPMAGETFRQFLKDIYQENLLIRNRMRLGGRRVDLKRIDMPLLLVMGRRDHLVPPSASRPLLDAVASTDKESKEIEAGHIGLSVGSRAHRELWPAVAEWISIRSDARQPPETPTPGRARRGRPPRKERGGAVGLQTLEGLGPSYARRLDEAGVKDARDLASADLDALSRKARIPISRLKAWTGSLEG
jgi:polyhydroxyalkanoate synthase